MNQMTIFNIIILLTSAQHSQFCKLSSVRTQIFQKKVISKYCKEIELNVNTCLNSILFLLQPIEDIKQAILEKFIQLIFYNYRKSLFSCYLYFSTFITSNKISV